MRCRFKRLSVEDKKNDGTTPSFFFCLVYRVTNVYTIVYVKYFLIYPIGLGVGVWYVRVTVRIPIGVS